MNLAAIFLLSAAGLLVFAVLIWHVASRREQQEQAQAHLEKILLQQQLGLRPDATNLDYVENHFLEFGPSSWQSLLFRAGYSPTKKLYTFLLAIILAVAAISTVLVSWGFAVLSALLSFMIIYLFLWVKAERIKKAMIKQIPGFLESMARMLTIGNSLGSAFQNSLSGIDAPLRPALDRVAALMYSGQSFDVALNTIAGQYRSRELHLVAGVITIAMQFGGRSDLVFQRMSRFMRDLEQARMELHALSAEVRLSAWILSLMPLGLTLVIMFLNPALLVGMWNDSTGRFMLYLAIGLQISGSFWLYRLAKSI